MQVSDGRDDGRICIWVTDREYSLLQRAVDLEAARLDGLVKDEHRWAQYRADMRVIVGMVAEMRRARSDRCN